MTKLIPRLLLNSNARAQATIEFSLAFMLILLFLVLTARLFVWFNGGMLRRQLAYEESRVLAGTSNVEGGEPGKEDFYTRNLDILDKAVFK